MPGPDPTVRLESPLPASLPAGSATALFLYGVAGCDGRPVSGLELLVGGSARPAAAHAMPRFDMAVRRSGFWGVVDVRMPAAGAVALGARLRLAGGPPREVELGTIPVGPAATTPIVRSDRARPASVAICLASYEPQPDLFRAQIDSLRAQTDEDWVCVISDDGSSPGSLAQMRAVLGDDPRFVLVADGVRRGFYRNFERALELAPADAELLALCDQDDRWHPDKLARLRAGLGDSVLVYSDLRLVEAGGRVLRDTLWRGRANNHTNLASMLVANTITGAAMLMRREVVRRALPFPDAPGIEFHDHWLALVALACGRVAYVDAPLYDYVQHTGAVVGKVAGETRRQRHPPTARAARAAYFVGYAGDQVRARTALLRAEDVITETKRVQLERFVAAERSPRALLWLLARPLRALAGRTETLAAEWELAPGIAWFAAARLLAQLPGWPDRLTLDARFPDPLDFEHRRLRRWRSRTA